jgi:hypothetical protein
MEKISFRERNWFINNITILNENNIYSVAYSEEMISPGNFRQAYYLLNYDGNIWAVKDSNITSNGFNRSSFPDLIIKINNNLYGSGDKGIVKMIGENWQVIGPNIYGQINGTNEKNIFLGNQSFGIMHYNGEDWFTFSELPKLRYTDIEVFENFVFLIASDGNKTFIVKGIIQ